MFVTGRSIRHDDNWMMMMMMRRYCHCRSITIVFITDNVDECVRGLHDCDEHATCRDGVHRGVESSSDIHYNCTCNPGYNGDGRVCNGASNLISDKIPPKSVCLSVCPQTAGRNSCSGELSQTVRVDCHPFLSRVRISVRPSNFFIGENHKTSIAKTVSPREFSVECTNDRSRATHRKGAITVVTVDLSSYT